MPVVSFEIIGVSQSFVTRSGKSKIDLNYYSTVGKIKAEVRKHTSLDLNIEFLYLVS